MKFLPAYKHIKEKENQFLSNLKRNCISKRVTLDNTFRVNTKDDSVLSVQ